MRPVSFGSPPPVKDAERFAQWVKDCMSEIDRASNEQAEAVADAYTPSNYTATRTLDAGTATATDVANVICTFLDDLKNRGTKRSQ